MLRGPKVPCRSVMTMMHVVRTRWMPHQFLDTPVVDMPIAWIPGEPAQYMDASLMDGLWEMDGPTFARQTDLAKETLAGPFAPPSLSSCSS